MLYLNGCSFVITVQVDSSEFQVERSVTVVSAGSSGTEANVEVTYEPSRIGESHASLTVFSPTGIFWQRSLLIQCTLLKDCTVPTYGC